jgi:hypothetical protein
MLSTLVVCRTHFSCLCERSIDQLSHTMWRVLAVVFMMSACATCAALSPRSAAAAPPPSLRHSDSSDHGLWPSALTPFLTGGFPGLAPMLTHHLPAVYAPYSPNDSRTHRYRWGFPLGFAACSPLTEHVRVAFLSIPVDVAEKADSFELHASLPGVPKENVQVGGVASARFSMAHVSSVAWRLIERSGSPCHSTAAYSSYAGACAMSADSESLAQSFAQACATPHRHVEPRIHSPSHRWPQPREWLE